MPPLPPSPVIDAAFGPLLAQASPPHLPFYWHLPLLIVLVSLVYSATRFDQWGAIVHESARWGLRLTAFIFCIVALLWGMKQFFID
ncbi:MAG TPA: hypothetical protein VGG61_04585 [Gemmataceae bacterium]|jgi:hypothetical protein